MVPTGFYSSRNVPFFCYEPFSSEISSIHKLFLKCFKGCYGAVPAVETKLYKMKSSLRSSNQTLNSYWGAWWQVVWLQNKPNSSASHQHADSWGGGFSKCFQRHHTCSVVFWFYYIDVINMLTEIYRILAAAVGICAFFPSIALSDFRMDCHSLLGKLFLMFPTRKPPNDLL